MWLIHDWNDGSGGVDRLLNKINDSNVSSSGGCRPLFDKAVGTGIWIGHREKKTGLAKETTMKLH